MCSVVLGWQQAEQRPWVYSKSFKKTEQFQCPPVLVTSVYSRTTTDLDTKKVLEDRYIISGAKEDLWGHCLKTNAQEEGAGISR